MNSATRNKYSKKTESSTNKVKTHNEIEANKRKPIPSENVPSHVSPLISRLRSRKTNSNDNDNENVKNKSVQISSRVYQTKKRTVPSKIINNAKTKNQSNKTPSDRKSVQSKTTKNQKLNSKPQMTRDASTPSATTKHVPLPNNGSLIVDVITLDSVNNQCLIIPNTECPEPSHTAAVGTQRTVSWTDVGTSVGTQSETISNVVVGTQTENISNDDIHSWKLMKEGFLNKICEQERELQNLRDHIATIEKLLTEKNVKHSTDTKHRNVPSSQPEPQIKTLLGPFICHIVGDSHVRDLSEKLSDILPTGCGARAFFQPGAGYAEVAQTLVSSPNLVNPSTSDPVMLICGTNDICSSSWEIIQSSIDSLVNKLQHCKLLCVLGVPLRYKNKKLNYHIVRFNTKMKNYITSLGSNILFVNPNKFLKPKDYAGDGLHLNRGGKTKLCQKLKSILTEQSQQCVVVAEQGASSSNTNDNATINIESEDLISFEERALVNYHNRNVNNSESSFSSDPTLHNTILFPNDMTNDTLIDSNINTSEQQYHTSFDNFPDYINNLIHDPIDYYNSVHISRTSFANVEHSSPISTITPGYNRAQTQNFPELGLTKTT
uniref:Uncharacterized protein n=1 Tax=Cacopsylla melanoneura TaxID=428564 RepID=A0A8D8Z850_9HEMI